MPTPQVELVRDRRSCRFVAFPDGVSDDPLWVPPFFRERMRFFDPKHNPFFEHAEVQLFWPGAMASGRDHRRHRGPEPHCLSQQQAFSATLSRWMTRRSRQPCCRRRATGWRPGDDGHPGPHEHVLPRVRPAGDGPTLAGGHDDPQPRYYEALITGAGFQKAMDLYAYLTPPTSTVIRPKFRAG